jgi:uncharacterized protein (TIGR02996 family)
MAKGKQATRGIRQGLEEALIADPDDLAAHMAYADWLSEQDDPKDRARGEFIQVQLALEDESRPAAERRKLRVTESRLLEKHQREWLGELAPFLLDEYATPEEEQADVPAGVRVKAFQFRRGWLDQLHLAHLSLSLARVLRRAPAAGLLRELVVEEAHDYESAHQPTDGVPPAGDGAVAICPLVGSPALVNLRRLQLGPDQGDNYQDYSREFLSGSVVNLVRGMPKLEQLYLFANGFDLNGVFALRTLKKLRVLLVYHGQQVHRLQILAGNPAFAKLTHLLLHPHCLAWHRNGAHDEADDYRGEEGYLPLSVVRPLLRSKHLTELTHLRLRVSSMGDEGCNEIVTSGILKRLRMLDLRHGRVTDAGARTLAQCPDVKRLEWLDLDRNGLTAEGVALVKGLGIPVRVDDQQTQRELHPREAYLCPQYLNEGEFE